MKQWLGWVLVLVASTASAQLSMEQRIEAARAAALEKQRKDEADAKAKEGAAKAASLPAITPTVIINGSPSRVGALAPVQPGVFLPPADRIELLRLSGFMDDGGNQLEAVVAINGQRYTVSRRNPRFGDGWELLAIDHEKVEVAKGVVRRQVAFVPVAAGPQAVPLGPASAR